MVVVNQDVNISRLSGLELAKYVLLRLVNYQYNSIGRVAENFENDEQFISGVVTFLLDIGWIKQDSNGYFQITKRGERNIITSRKPKIITANRQREIYR